VRARRYDAGPYGRRGPALRATFLVVALVVWALTLGGRLRRHGAVVLCYHAVQERERERFAKQLRLIGQRGIATSEIANVSGPGRPRVALTFDDAFECLIDNALPALEASGVPASVYAVTEASGKTPFWEMPAEHPERGLPIMSEAQLREADARPLVTVGSHTMTHPKLTELADEPLRRELRESKARLEQILGRAVDELAYPHGDHDERVDAAATSAGYRRLLTLEPRVERGERGPLLGRFIMDAWASPLEFRLTIDGAYAWLGALRRLRAAHRRPVPATGMREATT
jgi:peptidoglycan/xylan/chitin deacetylase (PgdA/CDA1 family)